MIVFVSSLLSLTDLGATNLNPRSLDRAPRNFFSTLTYPTDPLPIKSLVNEWDASAAVALNLSFRETLSEPDLLRFYQNIVIALTPHLPVLIGYDPEEAGYLEEFNSRLLSGFSQPEKFNSIQYMPTYTRSNWIRDFAPIFGYQQYGEIVAIDTSYRRLQEEVEVFSNSPSMIGSRDDRRPIGRFYNQRRANRKNEIAPLFITRYLRQNLRQKCDISRPLLHLQGGDFLSDGSGRVFISEDTLAANGGKRSHTLEEFRNYFAAEELHVLEALPGGAARHLDMSFKFLDANTLIAATPPEVLEGSSRHARHLSLKCQEIYRENISYLQKELPDLKILEVPTPPILDDDPDQFAATIHAQLADAACQALDIDFDTYVLEVRQGTNSNLKAKVFGWLSQKNGTPVNFSDTADIDHLCRLLLGASLNEFKENYVSIKTVYRSYTNSLLVTVRDGAKIILIPRYLPSPLETANQFSHYEKDVEAAYRSVYSDATIYWIDCDSMSERLGALHCLLVNIPLARFP